MYRQTHAPAFNNVNLPFSIAPRPIISNEREHAGTMRLMKIEHSLDDLRKQENSDRSAIKDDLSQVMDVLHNVADFDNQTHVTLSNYASVMNRIDQERHDESTALLAAIANNASSINSIIKDVNQLDIAERANLILHRVIGTSRATAKVSEIAADTVGTIPVFGASVSNGAKVLSHTAELVADTAEAIQSSGILRTLDELFKSVAMVNDRPSDLVQPALKTATTAGDLIEKIKAIIERNTRTSNLAFEKIHSLEAPMHSYSERPYEINEYHPIIRYVVQPTLGSVSFVLEFNGSAVSYKVLRQSDSVKGDLGSLIYQAGSFPPLPKDLVKVHFNCVVSSHKVYAFIRALIKNNGVSPVDRMFFIEQFFVLGLKPDLPVLLNEYESELHDVILKVNGTVDWFNIEAEHGPKLKESKIRLKRQIAADHGDKIAKLHVPSNFSDLKRTCLNITLNSKHKIGNFHVYDHVIGPFLHSGDFSIYAVIDDLNFSSVEPWYAQITGCNGQSVIKSDVSGIPVLIGSLKISDEGVLKDYGNDRIKVRVYAKNPFTVRLITGWLKTSEIKHLKPIRCNNNGSVNRSGNSANSSVSGCQSPDVISACASYVNLLRHIDPKILGNGDYNYHPWSAYNGKGNWTNIVRIG